MDGERNCSSSSTKTSSSLGDNPILNAVSTLLSKQHNISQGDVMPFDAQLMVLTNGQGKNAVEANAPELNRGFNQNKADDLDSFIPSFEQVHALATANLLASTQRDIAQQLAEASFSIPETQTSKRQQSRLSPFKKKDAKNKEKLIVKKRSSTSDDILIIPEPKALICSFGDCNRKFASARHLKYHEMTHTGNRQFECPDKNCGKSFYTAQRLEVHLRTHTGEKPFKCSHEDCGKTFTTAGNLKNHERIHTGEQPFACDADGCNRRFTEYSSLHKHRLTHSGDKPFECKICNKKFTQSGSRRQHLIRHHLDEEIRNSLKASRFKKATKDLDAKEKKESKIMMNVQNSSSGKSKVGESSLTTAPRLMVLSSAFHSLPSSESVVVSEDLVSLNSNSNNHHHHHHHNHNLSLSNNHQHLALEQKISSHNLLSGVYEETLDINKSNELVALSQASIYRGEDQDQSVLYVTGMLDQEEVTPADYHVSQEDASEEMVTSLEYHPLHHHGHNHQNTNSIRTNVSLHHSNESQHSDFYNNHQDYNIQQEEPHLSNTTNSYLTADGEVLHEEFIETKEISISSSVELANVSEEDPAYIPVKESVSTLIDWDGQLHKH